MNTDPNTQKRSKLPMIIGIIIVLLAVITLGLWGISRFNSTRNQQRDNNQTVDSKTGDQFSNDYGKGCKNNAVSFSYSPLAIEDTRYIQPMGLMNDGHVTPVDHIYMSPKDPNAAEGSYSVVMPADGEVLAVESMPAEFVGDQKGMTRPADDYRLVVRFSCRYYSIFIHVHELSPAIKIAAGNLQPGQNSHPINVPVKAGEMLAKLGNKPFDWTMVDTQTSLTGFITPSLYNGEPWKIHSINPFTMYSEELKTKLEALSLRSVAPFDGKIDYDVKGALVGNWFKQGSGGYSSSNGESTNRYYDGHLAIAPDYIDPASTIVSIGNWEGTAKQFLVKGKIDPAAVTSTSGLTKYELLSSNNYKTAEGKQFDYTVFPKKPLTLGQDSPVQGTILFEVLSGEKLKVEKFPGKKAADVTDFTSAAQIYER